MRSGSHGLRVGPKSGLSVSALWPNSEVLVLPRTTAPAAAGGPPATASSSGTGRRRAASRRSCARRACRARPSSRPARRGAAPAARPSSPRSPPRGRRRGPGRRRTRQNALRRGLSASMRASSSGGQLDGRELLVADQRGDLERRPPGEILVNHGSLLGTAGALYHPARGRRRAAPRCSATRAGAASASTIAAAATSPRLDLGRRRRGWARRPCACPTPRGSSSSRAPRTSALGPSDVLHREGEARPLTHFAALDWAAIDAIPPWPSPRDCPPARAPPC